jgi:hypothetical protein
MCAESRCELCRHHHGQRGKEQGEKPLRAINSANTVYTVKSTQ